MAFFTIAFLWLFGLFFLALALVMGGLFAVYRLTGGKRSFIVWFRAMGFIW